LKNDTTILPNAPDDTHAEILRATFRVLCERGYTGVTISRIATRTDIAKSVVYYHYEDKDDIVQTLLDQVLAELLSEYFRDSDDNPARRLEKFFGFIFAVADGNITDTKSNSDMDENADLNTDSSHTAEKGFKHYVGAHSQAYVELRSQAAHDQVFRETIQANERKLRDELYACLDAGVAAGTFDIDSVSDATELLVTLIEGAIFRGATTDEVDTEALADIIERKLGIIIHEPNL
jgi:Transcriptional regulator